MPQIISAYNICSCSKVAKENKTGVHANKEDMIDTMRAVGIEMKLCTKVSRMPCVKWTLKTDIRTVVGGEHYIEISRIHFKCSHEKMVEVER